MKLKQYFYMPISERKIQQIQQELQDLGIEEKDLKESFTLASGKGGQKVQKTRSAVQLLHLPTQLQVRCEQERDRESNRHLARRKLAILYREKILKQNVKKSQIDKIRKQKQKRKKRSQDKHSK